MATIHLPQVFREFIEFLDTRKVEYLIVGGYAVNYHGWIRNTGDIDFWVGANPENWKRLLIAVGDFGLEVESLDPETLAEGDFLRIGNPPFRIEILTKVDGVDFEECHKDAVSTVSAGQRINIISWHHLFQNKKASDRLKDVIDLAELTKIHNKNQNKK